MDYLPIKLVIGWLDQYQVPLSGPDGSFKSTGACNLDVPGSNPGRAEYFSSWLYIYNTPNCSKTWSVQCCLWYCALYRQTDRQTYILLTERSHYRLICHRNERYICTCIYKIVNLLKSYDDIHGITYRTKIMLSGSAKIKTVYFDNINDYYYKLKGIDNITYM